MLQRQRDKNKVKIGEVSYMESVVKEGFQEEVTCWPRPERFPSPYWEEVGGGGRYLDSDAAGHQITLSSLRLSFGFKKAYKE